MPSSSASSSDASSESSETGKSSGDPLVRRLCCHWLPRSYLLVFVINATATGLLGPAEDQDADHDAPSCPLLKIRLFFSGLMLSSLGAGFVAAFLVRRAEASPHTRWACGYAIVSWIQAILTSQGTRSPNLGWCRFGVLPSTYGNAEGQSWYVRLTLCRLLLYLLALFWMQTLISSRLDLLEKSSKRNYRSACFRRLMWAQILGAAMALIPIAGIFDFDTSRDFWVPICWYCLILIGSSTVLCNAAASMVAICSLVKSYLELRRICRLAEATEASTSAVSSLRQARRFAGQQATGVSFSLVFSLLLVPASYFGMGAGEAEYNMLAVACFFIQAFDALGNAVAVLLLAGSHRMSKAEERLRSRCCKTGTRENVPQNSPLHLEIDSTWSRKVEELSMPG